MTGVVDVAVVGGGVIGQAVAWRLARRDRSVVVVDPQPGEGASWAAAGMLAPVTEAGPGEQRLTDLGLASLRRWPGFAAELVDDDGGDVGLRTEGTLAAAFDDDDREALAAMVAWQRGQGLSCEWLTGRECRRLEPLLSPRVAAGALVAGDHQVDPRALLTALGCAGRRRGVRWERQRVQRVVTARDRATGVALDDGTVIPAGTVVVAAGAWSGTVDGLEPAARLPVRPVKGEILRLRAGPTDPVPARTVRARVQGSAVYVVPRASGEVVVGATSEEAGFDVRVRAGAVAELLRAAVAVLPALGELEVAELTARLRPGTPDNGPVLGATPLRGLLVATGHHRNGVLLAPVTADAIEAAVCGEPPPPEAEPFGPGRFR